MESRFLRPIMRIFADAILQLYKALHDRQSKAMGRVRMVQEMEGMKNPAFPLRGQAGTGIANCEPVT